jgi:hypothetical protein
MKNPPCPIDDSLKRELAVKASVCPRTIGKVLRGEPVRGGAGRRARQALAAAGFLSRVPTAAL